MGAMSIEIGAHFLAELLSFEGPFDTADVREAKHEGGAFTLYLSGPHVPDASNAKVLMTTVKLIGGGRGAVLDAIECDEGRWTRRSVHDWRFEPVEAAAVTEKEGAS